MSQQITISARIWKLSCLAILSAIALLTSYPHSYAKDKPFYVPINRSELIVTSSNMGEVIIADPEIADVYVHGKNKISVIGRGIGTTTLRVFSPNNRLIRSMDVVVTYDLPAIRKALKEFLPGERIGVELVNTRVALTGEVTSSQSANTAIEIAEQFVRNKLQEGDLEARTSTANDNARQSPVLNLMSVSAGQQVMLRIRIGEITRSAVRNLGVNLQAVRNGSLGFRIGTGAVPNQIGTVAANIPAPAITDVFGQFEFSKSTSNGAFGAAFDALEQDGLLKTLAEPNLVAISGEPAEFLAGGEFPIPVPQGNQTTTIEFRQFGIALRFTPFVLSENRIRIQVAPEVSSLSTDGAIQTEDGLSVPSIVTRRASTTVELAPGESFMIAGLIQDDITSQIQQFPGASEVPILGALLRSTSFTRAETEVVFAVTPYLVDPLRGSDIKLPTDNFRPASTMEALFYGALGKVFGSRSPSPSAEGPVGFITD